MKKRYMPAVLLAAVLVMLMIVVAVGEAINNDQKCPAGQELVQVKANGLVLENRKAPPPGMHYSDTSDGVRVESDRDSASGNVPLRIECR